MSDRVQGNIRNMAGRAQEAVGDAVGDTRTQARGVYNQAAGQAQDAAGQVGDMIRDQPITAAAICIGIGYILGKIL
jgi:uncharacterized protein YjbJ (UPF0337 family)